MRSPLDRHLNVLSLNEEYLTSAGKVAAGRIGSGPALVLAHGWPWSSYCWHRVLPELSKRFTLHFYDMPGFGRSEMDAKRATGLDAQGLVMAEMFANWNLTKPHILAHDFGGAITLRAHLLGEVDFQTITLMNVVALRPWGSSFFDHVGRHIEAFFGLPDHIHKAVAEAYMRGAFAHPIEDEDVSQLLAPWLSDKGRQCFYRQFQQADEALTAEFEPHLSKMRCPVSVLWGEDDPWISISQGRKLAEKLGDVPFQPLQNAGHLPQLEKPDVVVSAYLKAHQGMGGDLADL